jgi:cellobiose-specific phosphotransferase system component IIB|tara:strand:- start:96 stop:422 length:327 start_codon:yes stop_codon:yes gene_type:complete
MTELTEVPFKPSKIKEYSQEELQENFSTFLAVARQVHYKARPDEELHWKDRLVALIPKADFQMYDRAVVYFTGGPLEDISVMDGVEGSFVKDGMILVKTDGYWECIGA